MGEIRSPGDFICEELNKRGWTQEDLAAVLDRSKSRVNEIILGKQSISVEVATDLASAFGSTAQVWLERETAYRLSLTKSNDEVVRRRAALFEIAPIKDMQKRGWIPTGSTNLERDVLTFFQLKSLDEKPDVHGALRKSSPSFSVTPQQMAWAYRVRQLAATIPSSLVGRFDASKIGECQNELRALAAFSKEVKKVPAVLMNYGIRFVLVEGLTGAKIDGFATWLDDDSPVIGMSLRFNRLDSFWFTLCHELTHIKYRDIAPIDGEVGNLDEIPIEMKPPIERRADKEAAEMLIPPAELASFIRRVGPLYSTEKINQFANRLRIHPNIIVGQLKYLGEIKHSTHNKGIVKIQDYIVNAAFGDGWGNTTLKGEI